MCRTPAPPSTAAVARAIWSGVGEVNTAPGHAASSMPRPTKPPCRGSWPLPPPDTRPTLPLRGASLRMITFGSYSTRIRSACAAAIPAMASLTSVSGVLINFLSLVVTVVCAIVTSSYLAAGNTRRNMNRPIPFPISSPSPMARRLIPSSTGLKGGVSTASSTAPMARPPPPISRMRFSRWRGVRGTAARGRGERSIPRPPGALPSCRLSRRDTILLRPRPRRFRYLLRNVRTDGSRQVLVHHEVVDVSAQWAADQWHQGRDPDVEVRPGDCVRAVANQQHPEPRPEVTSRVQGRHLDRRKEPDQGRY